ncbi:1,4-dihydroxy-2-naphthoate octaprenyltransferase [Dysgonomonadaceae bacterium PH5-43]|nr:1,4-dihydroxy-2-naphthoate octaprenyltransferase [Dysgonomonadaceae bacterium PH5-43]
MNIIRFWINNARPSALPQSVLPAILAACLASQTESFSLILGLVAIFGVITGHLGLNLFDDYFDYKVKSTEFRNEMQRKGFRARIAKCAYLTSGNANLKQLLIACIVFCAISTVAGSVIWFVRGNFILWIAIAIAVLGISYSGSPLRLSYRGLGEIVIGIIFGPLLMIGVYYAACGRFDGSVVFISIPVGLLVANIVYTHAIMDYEPDKEVGKMTFAVLLNNHKLMLIASFCILFLPFAIIVGGIISGYLSAYYLFTLLTLPMAITLFYLVVKFIEEPQRKFSPRFWMGPMGNWSRMQAMNLDWFMIRWFLARNLLSFFCLIIIIVSFIA